MSILQEYEEIRHSLGEKEFALIEKYLECHPDVLLSDIYYNEKAHDLYVAWKKDLSVQPTKEEINMKAFPLLGYEYVGGYHNGSVRLNTMRELAKWISSSENDKTVTDIGDQLVLKTFGSFIDICPDREFLTDLLKILAPYQLGEEEEDFDYTDAEEIIISAVDQYCNIIEDEDLIRKHLLGQNMDYEDLAKALINYCSLYKDPHIQGMLLLWGYTIDNIKELGFEIVDPDILAYLRYVEIWKEEHSDPECEGMEPACFEEFLDMEYTGYPELYDEPTKKGDE